MSQTLVQYTLTYECDACGTLQTIRHPLIRSAALPSLQGDALRAQLVDQMELGKRIHMCPCHAVDPEAQS